MQSGFLKDIAIVLGIAALTSSIARRLRLPTILGYLIAGLIIAPFTSSSFFPDAQNVKNLSEFGVILVMFSIGLDFRLSKLFQVLPIVGITSIIEIGMMFLTGLSVGYLFSWSTAQSIFLGGALSISSTMIVSKVFEEKRPSSEIKEYVFGILIVQDIAAVLILTLLGTYAASQNIQMTSLLPSFSKLISVLIFSTIIGLFFIPKYIRFVSKQKSPEVLTIVAIGICFIMALFIESLGYSVALGSFIAGILISESGEGHKVERHTRPLKDVFVAIFFVSVGMSIDPHLTFQHLPEAIFISIIVLLIQFHIVFLGGVLSGAGLEKSISSALILGQIGEFAFIISMIGLKSGVINESFQAIIISVTILTSLCTPFLWKNSDSISTLALKWMPEKLRLAIGLYEAWFSRLTSFSTKSKINFFGVPKKIILAMAIDALLLIFIPPAIFKFLPHIILQVVGSENDLIKDSVILVTLLVITLPILHGFIKNSSLFITHLTKIVFTDRKIMSIEIEAAKKLFSLTIWSLITIMIGVPMLSALRPFTDTSIFLFILILMILGVLGRLWLRAKEVVSDFQSGGERLVSVLKSQTYKSGIASNKPLDIPGLEELESFKIKNPKLFEKSLAEINLRKVTGVTIVSIIRKDSRILFPNHEEILHDGDIVQVWGPQEAKETCRKLLSQKH